MGERTKFEIRFNDQARWFVDKVYPDKAKAEKIYNDHVANEATQYYGVQLVRVWSRADGAEVEKVINEATLTPKTAPVRLANIDDAPICAHDEDYYALPARMMMGRLLRAYLDREGLIPSELLLSYDHGKRFMAGDLVTSAIDRIATLQAKTMGIDSRKRRDALWTQVQSMIDGLKAVQKTKAYQKIDTDDVQALYSLGRGLKHPIGQNMAFVKILMRSRSLEGKVEQLLAWLADVNSEDGDNNAAIDGILDGFVAECLSSVLFIQDALGPQRSLASALIFLLDWMDGKVKESKGANPDFVRQTARYFKQGRLAQSRDVLFDFFLRQLSGKQPLVRHNPDEEEKAFLAIFHRVASPDGMVGGPDMAVALTRRYARGLKQGGESGERLSIKWLLDTLTCGADRLVYLLALDQSDLGEAHPDIVHQGLYALHHTTRSIDDFFKSSISPKPRLTGMHGLHILVEEADIEAQTKQSLLFCLDRMVEKYLIDSALIDKIDNPAASLRERAINLVEFCGSGVLWPKGQAMELARKRVIDHLKGASFIEKFTEDEEDAGLKDEMIRDFYVLMARAGFKQ